MQANLTFMQSVICGDSWGATTIPIIEAYPWTAPFFVAVVISLHLAMLNLIMAVIVDKAHERRQEDVKRLAKKRENEAAAAQDRFLGLCEELDQDQDGTLTLKELYDGFEQSPELRDTLRVMDINKGDLDVVFRILDADHSGDVDYKEFAEQLYKMKNHSAQTFLVFIKHYVTEIRCHLVEQVKEMGKVITKEMMQHMDEVVTASRSVTCPGSMALGPFVRATEGPLPLGIVAPPALTSGDMLQLERSLLLARHQVKEDLDTITTRVDQEVRHELGSIKKRLDDVLANCLCLTSDCTDFGKSMIPESFIVREASEDQDMPAVPPEGTVPRLQMNGCTLSQNVTGIVGNASGCQVSRSWQPL